MLILGIDTSCDDTAASVVEDGTKVLSNIVSGQEGIHARYGGIVPELASRRHIEMIWSVTDEALKYSGVRLDELSAVAVCRGPGLIGSLLVGCSFAKAICFSNNIPLVPVNHLEGHIFSCFLELPGDRYHDMVSVGSFSKFPFVSLIVSGGHTSLYRVDGFGKYRELGRTRDDAAGEAYDKVAKLLGLGYPGGPAIDKLAQSGNPDAIAFPRAYLPESLDFSFSGLKTAVVNYVKREKRAVLSDICASFQKSVVDVLVRKAAMAISLERIERLTVSGGVAANIALRQGLEQLAEREGAEICMPQRTLCTDNAAMIAAAGYHHLMADNTAALDLNPSAYLQL